MKEKKTVRVKDEKNDDFAALNVKAETVGADYRYVRKGPLWLAAEFVLYRIIATPLVFLMAKLLFGLRIKNRRSLLKLKKTGYFLYGNHTQNMMDAYTPSLAVFPRHAHIVVGAAAVSVPVLRRIVQFLGGIPVPGTATGYRAFMEALNLRIKQNRVITIYPEAHIWPWFTGIRPFPDSSFAYPVSDNVPVIAFTTTFRKRKVFKNLWPCLTVTLSEPFYPDTSLSPREAKKKLRNQVYDFMCKVASDPDNFIYYEYRRKSVYNKES